MLAAIYRRVSTDHQDGSLAVQEERVLQYAAYKKLDLDEGYTFSDPDTSGSVPILDRSGGRALLNRLKAGGIQHLIIAKLDRLGRNTRDFLTTIETLHQLGVTLHIADFGGDAMSTQGHFGKMILTILAAVAEAELGEIRDRVQKRMDHKFERGELTGNVPYGFDGQYTFADGHVELRNRAIRAGDLADLVHEHGPVRSKLLVANATEQDWIHRIADWRGSRSFKAVADQLNSLGVPSKQGGKWQCGQVDSLLSSRHTARVLKTSVADSPLVPLSASSGERG